MRRRQARKIVRTAIILTTEECKARWKSRTLDKAVAVFYASCGSRWVWCPEHDTLADAIAALTIPAGKP